MIRCSAAVIHSPQYNLDVSGEENGQSIVADILSGVDHFFVLSLSTNTSAEQANESQAVDWWIGRALNSLSEIDVKNALSGASHALAYPLIRNNRLDDAARVVKDVMNLQKRVYVQAAVAKTFGKSWETKTLGEFRYC